jgi:penicillin-binding protein 2
MKSLVEREAAASRIRIIILGVIMLLGLGYLLFCLHNIQIEQTRAFASAQEFHSLRRVRLPATRGKILDRNGIVLADNKPSYCVSVYLEEMRQKGAWTNTINFVAERLDEISEIVGVPCEVDKDIIWTHIRRRRAIPLVAFRGLDDVAVARLSENAKHIRGIDISVQAERVYPYGDVACHVIGYVGKGQPANLEQELNPSGFEDFNAESLKYDFLLPDFVGKDGIEKAYNSVLAGVGGGELIRINAVGYRHESYKGKAPELGKDVHLTLDLHLQKIAERALDGSRGSIIVMDCETGELLVVASAPRYDLSRFVPSLASSYWRQLLDDPMRPLYGRACNGVYAIGSVFKPLIALSALREGVINDQTHFYCSGNVDVGDVQFNCARKSGHGDINLRQAICTSCNPFFIYAGLDLQYEPHIYKDALDAGFGQIPQLEIPCSRGVLPTSAWKISREHDRWRDGDTANISMGQGFLSATPLQVAVFASALANGGKVLRPRLVPPENGEPCVGEVLREMNWREKDLALVHRGMWDVVNSGWGTGRRAKLDGISLAGKTGTAEYMEGSVKKKNAWMIAFAPFEKPKYAIVAMQEDSDAGGLSAAMLIKKMTQAIFMPNTVESFVDTVEENDEGDLIEIHELIPADINIDLAIHPQPLVVEPIIPTEIPEPIVEEENITPTESLITEEQ